MPKKGNKKSNKSKSAAQIEPMVDDVLIEQPVPITPKTKSKSKDEIVKQESDSEEEDSDENKHDSEDEEKRINDEIKKLTAQKKKVIQKKKETELGITSPEKTKLLTNNVFKHVSNVKSLLNIINGKDNRDVENLAVALSTITLLEKHLQNYTQVFETSYNMVESKLQQQISCTCASAAACSTRRCKCHKNGLGCSPKCVCRACVDVSCYSPITKDKVINNNSKGIPFNL